MSDDARVADVLREIQENTAGKLRLKVKSLMERFGYSAGSRVRQASWDAVKGQLEAVGVTVRLPSDSNSSNDWVTLSVGQLERSMRPPSITRAAAVEGGARWLDPLSALFRFNAQRFGDSSQDLFGLLWLRTPVCLVVDASEEYFSLAAGLVSAVMRRRAMVFSDRQLPSTPSFMSLELLRRLAGRADTEAEPLSLREGQVLIVRADLDDSIDELTALLRETRLPHTYYLEAPPGESSTKFAKERPEEFSRVLEWFRGFAGTRHVELTDSNFEFASLLAECGQLRDVLLARAALQPADEAFNAGFESEEHMALKNLAARCARQRFPNESVLVEARVDFEGDAANSARHARPDVCVPDRLWIEVETLRGSTFLGLEAKLARKLELMKRHDEVWLLVPADLLALATAQCVALARSLRLPQIKLGSFDLHDGDPFFVPVGEAEPQNRLVAKGTPARKRPSAESETQLSLKNIAGYADFKQRIDEDVLHPLQHRATYRARGLGGANGLMLYGLPGCGKSLMGRAIAGTLDTRCRLVVPSDLTSQWIGAGVEKIRELFDWALRQQSCVLVIDELDAIAPQRAEGNMHSDEKRQVNELLTQLDRINGQPVTVVATTNYFRGIDAAIRRSGRFDIKVPVFPPTEGDRREIFTYYLKRYGVEAHVDALALAKRTRLFAPADIRTVVERTVRRSIRTGEAVDTRALDSAVAQQPRSIHARDARAWLEEARAEIPQSVELDLLQREVSEVFGLEL